MLRCVLVVLSIGALCACGSSPAQATDDAGAETGVPTGVESGGDADGEVRDTGPETSPWGPCAPMEWFEPDATPVLAQDLDIDDAILTPLPDGRVLVGAAESVYDPKTDTYVKLASASSHRDLAAVVVTKDQKSVVIMGGFYGEWSVTNAVTILDLATLKERATKPMQLPRVDHTAVVLGDGRIMAIGGDTGPYDGFVGMPAAEIFDPVAETWTPTSPPEFAPPSGGFARPQAVLVGPNDVLITTANSGCANYRYDATTNTWKKTSNNADWQWPRQPVVLPDGRVFAEASTTCNGSEGDLHAIAYDPGTETWTRLADPIHGSGINHEPSRAWFLTCGRLLKVADGGTGSIFIDLYDPVADAWASAAIAEPYTLRSNTTNTAAQLNDESIMSIWGRLDATKPVHSFMGMPLFLRPTRR